MNRLWYFSLETLLLSELPSHIYQLDSILPELQQPALNLTKY